MHADGRSALALTGRSADAAGAEPAFARRLGMSASVSADNPNVPASTANAGLDPTVATSAPPSAGPNSEPTRTAAMLIALPAAS